MPAAAPPSPGRGEHAEKLSDEEWKGLSSRSPAESDGQPSGADGSEEAPSRAPQTSSMAWMDVGLRSQVSPGEEPEQKASPETAPQAPDQLTASKPNPAHKERKEEFTLEEIEQLELFKGR